MTAVDTKISGLPDGGAILPGDLIPVSRSASGTPTTAAVKVGTAAAKTASDNSKANVASVAGTATAGHVVVFADQNGTVADGGALATVATSGAYGDLSGKPGLAAVATSGAYDDIGGKPTLGTLAAKNSASLTADVSGTLPVANGGTGATSAAAARNALLPPQSGNSGKSLMTNGTDASWGVPTAKGTRLPCIVAATIGDSYLAIGFNSSATTRTYTNENLITQLRSYLGGRIHIPLENCFAVGATDAASAVASIPNALAVNPDIIFVSTGRNNLQNLAYTWQQVRDIVMPGIATILNAGVDVVWLPVIQHAFNFNTVAQRQNMAAYNRLIYEVCSGQRPDLAAAFGFPPGRLPMAVDMRFMNDNTTGYALPDYVLADNTHGTAKLWFDAVHRPDGLGPAFDKRLPPRVANACVFDDVHHATNFPSGNLLTNGTVNDGLFAGTGGNKLTNAGVTPSGDVGDRWQALRQLGNSTATMACSKASPRADGLSGTAQRVAISISAAGTVFAELYRIGYNATIGGFSPGDRVFMHADYEVLADPIGFLGAACSFAEAGNATNQTASDGNAGTSPSARGPGVAHKKSLRTPIITLGASTNALYAYLYMWVIGTSASSLNIEWRDVALRKAVGGA